MGKSKTFEEWFLEALKRVEMNQSSIQARLDLSSATVSDCPHRRAYHTPVGSAGLALLSPPIHNPIMSTRHHHHQLQQLARRDQRLYPFLRR